MKAPYKASLCLNSGRRPVPLVDPKAVWGARCEAAPSEPSVHQTGHLGCTVRHPELVRPWNLDLHSRAASRSRVDVDASSEHAGALIDADQLNTLWYTVSKLAAPAAPGVVTYSASTRCCLMLWA